MDQKLDTIQIGIKRLQEMHQNARIEITRLETENKYIRDKLLAFEEASIVATEKQVLTGLTLGKASNPADRKRMKLKINTLLKEIDKCIALLNQ